jgi:hypothetical protein
MSHPFNFVSFQRPLAPRKRQLSADLKKVFALKPSMARRDIKAFAVAGTTSREARGKVIKDL